MAAKYLFTNRLIHEKSPYLLQHAHNPVDWYPWGEEAIQIAKAQKKPIFLSIGYATCHWCHTMEKESFEDSGIANLMNETFINIKVDREELPEVDALYMEFAQGMMAGSSGWPLNVILTPELMPFFAATYLPPTSQGSMMGLTELIQHIQQLWEGSEKEKIEFQASKIVEFFSQHVVTTGDKFPTEQMMQELLETYFKIADPIYGGLKGAPKFPVGYQYQFLLFCSSVLKDSRALFLVERTLDLMHRGGIYDHLGGGFSRYSVDNRWIIPHFEKMLYDNALLADAYISAWRYTKHPQYRIVACEILDYVLRDMTHPEGGFYSAEDADSEGREGAFYVWKYGEIEKLLGKERAKRFGEFYGVTEEGNFEGANVLHIPLGMHSFAEKHHCFPHELEAEFAEDKKILFAAREKRVHPLKDDKILTSWNALMIHALTEAGAAFNEPKYMDAAVKCIDFLRTYLWHGVEISRRWRDLEAMHRGGLDDYAFLIRALLTLFEKGKGTRYLKWAMELTDLVEKNFKIEGGAFYQSDGQDPLIILRRCSLSDGAEPSGNAVHCENLLRLYRITHNSKYLTQAEDVFRAVEPLLSNYSPGYFYHVMNIGRYYDVQAPTWIVRLNRQNQYEDEIKSALGASFQPYATVVFIPHEQEKPGQLQPILEEYPVIDDKTTLYCCYPGRCLAPIMDVHQMIEAIQKIG